METFFLYIKVFLVGGAICGAAQVLIDRTGLTPARIMTLLVVLGVLLGAVGLYKPLADWAGAGATTPIIGFGYALAKGVQETVAEKGWLGVFTAPLTAASAGIEAAVVFSLLAAVVFRAKEK